MNMNSVLLPILGVALLLATLGVINYATVDTLQVTIESKERMSTGTGENRRSFWIVFTDEEVFANKDNIWFFKFNSSDIQRQLVDGQTCQVKVNGFRVPIFSWYRNILEVQECR